MTHPPHGACKGIVARSPTLGDLATRLAAVYAKLRNIEEGGINAHQRYSFVSLGQVTDPVRLAMADAGIVVLPSVVESAEAEWPMRKGVGVRVTITIEFIWIAAESGEWITTRWSGMALDAGDKAYNRAYSAILKQALMKSFLLSSADVAEEDPDAGSPEHQQVRWNRFELESEVESLLTATEVGAELVERFKSYLIDVYRVNAWSDFAPARLVAIRDRLRSLNVEERRQAILEKASVADAA